MSKDFRLDIIRSIKATLLSIALYIAVLIRIRSLVFERNTLPYSIIIIVGFVWLIYCLVKDIWAYQAERRGLAAINESPNAFFTDLKMETGMEETANLGPIEITDSGHPKNLSVTKMEEALGRFWQRTAAGAPQRPKGAPSLTAVRLSDALIRSDSALPLEIDELSTSLVPYLNRSDQRLRRFVRVALSIGIFGTFLGMMHIFASRDIASAQFTISQFFGGLKEAFGSSLIAILTSIVAEIVHSDLSNHQMGLVQELDDFTKAQLIPRYQRKRETVPIQIDINEVAGAEIGERIREGIVAAIEVPVAEMTGAITQMRGDMSQFGDELKQYALARETYRDETIALIERFERMTQMYQTQLQNLHNQIAGLAETLSRSNEELSNSINLLENTSQLLESTVERFRDNMQELGDPLIQLSQQFSDLEVQLAEWGASMEAVNDKLGGWGATSARLLTRCEEILSTLRDDMAETNTRTNGAIRQASQAMGSVNEVAQRFLNNSSWSAGRRRLIVEIKKEGESDETQTE